MKTRVTATRMALRIRSAFGLVLNAMVLFNSRYMVAAVNRLRSDGDAVPG
jgi:hypothetical protein